MPYPAATPVTLIERLYDAVADPQGWPDFLTALASAAGGVVPAVYVTDRATGANRFHVVSGHDPAWGGAYEAYFKHRDLRRGRIEELPGDSVFVGSALVPDRELVGSEFYNDFLHPQGFFHLLGAVPWKTAETVAVVRVIRPRSAAPFGASDLGLFRRILPHLSRALRLHQRLVVAEQRRDESVGLLDRFPTGVLLLDAAGHMVASNRTGEALLSAGVGLRATREGLRAAVPGETAALQRLVARAATAAADEPSDGVLNITRPPPHRALNLLVAPLRGGPLRADVTRAAVVVFVTDPERSPPVSADAMQRWLGLTPAEAALVLELLRGLRVEEAADVLHITTNTARTQLKRALVKTGTGRQAELLRLALGAPHVLPR